MKKKFLLFIIIIVFLISILSLILILNFVDPYSSGIIGIFSVIVSFVLGLTTFLTLFFYLFKKVYYRGDVFLYHVYSSFRQGFLISLFILLNIIFYFFSIFTVINIFVIFALVVFLELFIRNFEDIG
ncbi:MAG: hypothetical protein WC850_05065 [Candidatus Gracilibacteria bacterium]